MAEFTPEQAYRGLQRLARDEGHGRTDQLLELYLHERFLARLSVSEHRDTFVLKGGMLLATFGIRRPTRDADLLALRISNDEETVARIVTEIAAIIMSDGVTFETTAQKLQLIREEEDYHGIRVRIPAAISTAQLTLALDISFDEHVKPKKVTVPTLLDDQDISLRGYPMENVVGEKVETMIALGDANTRDRDWADVLRLSYTHPFKSNDLRSALQQTAKARKRTLVPLRGSVDTLGERRQQNWAALLRKRHEEIALPGRFTEAIAQVIAFVDPVIDNSTSGKTWDHHAREWK